MKRGLFIFRFNLSDVFLLLKCKDNYFSRRNFFGIHNKEENRILVYYN